MCLKSNVNRFYDGMRVVVLEGPLLFGCHFIRHISFNFKETYTPNTLADIQGNSQLHVDRIYGLVTIF